jgi:hypothetical protein
MDLRQNGHTLRIIPGDQNHHMAVWNPGFKLDTVNYILRCCDLSFRVVPGVSHCMEQQNLLIIGVGSLNSSRLIRSYKVMKTWLAGQMQADVRGPLPHISFIPMAIINPEKLLMTKWTAVETKRTALFYNQIDTCNRWNHCCL